jgi:hypothetical protein
MEDLARFRKMLTMMPEGAVRQKMVRGGVLTPSHRIDVNYSALAMPLAHKAIMAISRRFRSDCVTISQRLRSNFAAIPHCFRSDCTASSQRFRSVFECFRSKCKAISHRLQSDSAAIVQRLPSDSPWIAQRFHRDRAANKKGWQSDCAAIA